jgi:hypothetical protein
VLPEDPRRRLLECSALDVRWMDEVDASRGVLVTAQGLFMYLEPNDVHRLVHACAERFPRGALVFDAVPRWFVRATQRGLLLTSGGLPAPPMHWALDGAERRRLRAHPRLAELRDLRLPRGRGAAYGYVLPALSTIPTFRRRLLTIVLARFR